MSNEETPNEETTESHDAMVERVLRSRYGKLMPKDESRKLIHDLTQRYYVDGRPVESPNILPPARANRVTVTKSPATLVALNEQPLPIEPIVAPVVVAQPEVTAPTEEKPVPQVIVKQENVIATPPPTGVKIAKKVLEMLGQTVASITVLAYDETESLIPRGEKQRPLPFVKCHCNACGRDFSMNVYNIGPKKDCGCTSKRKG